MGTQDLIKGINNGDFFLITEEERGLILPWLRNTLSTQEAPTGILSQALTTILESVDFKEIHNRNILLLTKEEAESFLTWLRDTLSTQGKEDHNSLICQALTRVQNTGHYLYGTGASTKATCICNG